LNVVSGSGEAGERKHDGKSLDPFGGGSFLPVVYAESDEDEEEEDDDGVIIGDVE